MVYNPVETLLIQQARDQGKIVIPGMEMFIEQAARQFEIWTGETAPRSIMEKAAIEALEAKTEAVKNETPRMDAAKAEAVKLDAKAVEIK
jgi:3-dehydroquinate dehydratase / shikimate dehydrogenase